MRPRVSSRVARPRISLTAPPLFASSPQSDEPEIEDQKVPILESCKHDHHVEHMHKEYLECAKRVESKAGDCSPQYFDYWHAMDHCVRTRAPRSAICLTSRIERGERAGRAEAPRERRAPPARRSRPHSPPPAPPPL